MISPGNTTANSHNSIFQRGQVKFSVKQKTKGTSLENAAAAFLREKNLLGYRRNARFIEARRFEADFWWPRLKLVLEVDGGEWLGKRGGHTSGRGYTRDRERDALALTLGILTVRLAGGQVKDGTGLELFERIWHMRDRGEL
jgi:very-short-patch-repair endonuclease